MKMQLKKLMGGTDMIKNKFLNILNIFLLFSALFFLFYYFNNLDRYLIDGTLRCNTNNNISKNNGWEVVKSGYFKDGAYINYYQDCYRENIYDIKTYVVNKKDIYILIFGIGTVISTFLLLITKILYEFYEHKNKRFYKTYFAFFTAQVISLVFLIINGMDSIKTIHFL